MPIQGSVVDYSKTEFNPFRIYVEQASFLAVVEDVQDMSVIDLACGPGNYTRTLKTWGATQVLGVDISEDMINRARALEECQPLGIEYFVRDVRCLAHFDYFDVATAVYLFQYAATKEALMEMAQGISNNLKSDGRLITVVGNPILLDLDHTENLLAAAEQHFLYMKVCSPIQDGTRIETTIYIPEQDEPLHLANYYWSKETYEEVLQDVGFQDITWHPMDVSEEGLQRYGQAYWESYVTTPHITILECYKQ